MNAASKTAADRFGGKRTSISSTSLFAWRAMFRIAFYLPLLFGFVGTFAFFCVTLWSWGRGESVPLAEFVRIWPGEPNPAVIAELLLPWMILVWAAVGCAIGWLVRGRRRAEGIFLRQRATRQSGRSSDAASGGENGATGEAVDTVGRLWRVDELRLRRMLARWGLPLACAVVCLRLAVVWSNVDRPEDPYDYAPYAAMLGHIPWSDAGGYYKGAQYYNTFGRLDVWNQRRPLNALLFAVRLSLCGQSLHLALLLQAILLAASLYLFAAAVANRYGLWAALAAFAITWSYGRLYVATTLSETLGLTIGAIAAALLLQAQTRGLIAQASLGGFAMGLAMAARAGALFLLPGLILWAAWQFGSGWRRRLVASLAMTAGIGAALLVNSLALRCSGTGENVAGSNFAPTFCGMAEGKSWGDMYEKYREQLYALNEKEQAAFFYRKAWEGIRADPSIFIGMMARGEKQFIRDLRPWVAGLTRLPLPPDRSIVRKITRTNYWLWNVMLAALPLTLWRWRHGGDWRLLLIVVLAMLASAPFLYLDGGFRVFAASWPLLILCWAIAFASAERPRLPAAATTKVAATEEAAAVSQKESGQRASCRLRGSVRALQSLWRLATPLERTSIALIAILTVAGLIGPRISHELTPKPTAQMFESAERDGCRLSFAWPRTAAVAVVRPGDTVPPGMPVVSVEQLERLIDRRIQEDIQVLRPLPATPFVIFSVSAFARAGSQVLICPPEAVLSPTGFVRLRLVATESFLYSRLQSAEPAEPE